MNVENAQRKDVSMKKIVLASSDPLFSQQEPEDEVIFDAEDYRLRLCRLIARMKARNITHVLIYGDREHFSNIEYFCGYDCRFEEGILLVDAEGSVSLLVGNEGLAYSEIIPYPVKRYLYQNFSLQGQPREKLHPIREIFADAGIDQNSRLGIVGLKYFENDMQGAPDVTFDLPAYILEDLCRIVPRGQVTNFTKELTGYPDGIRGRLYTAKEIAWAESAGNRVANAVQNMLAALRPGISEYDLSKESGAALNALNVHPMINFGPRSFALGLKSPLQSSKLNVGEPCSVCYSVRGNLTSKNAVAAYDLNSLSDALKPYYESFYQRHFLAMAAWYETVAIGATCGAVYDAVYCHINHEEHGITLNPGHSTGTEEWLNSAFYKGSAHKLQDGEFLQVDIIASKSDPVRTSICEDAVVLAGSELRRQLTYEYPEAMARIQKRQQAMRRVLGIQIADEVLPMSNLNGVYYPFMLNLRQVFSQC